MNINLTMWSPIINGMATLREMQDGTYNMEDLADMLEALAFRTAMETRSQKEH